MERLTFDYFFLHKLQHAFYGTGPPERCAESLWRDVEQKELASSALKLTANDLLKLGIIDSIMPEPGGGAHRNPDGAAQVLTEEIERFLAACKKGVWSPRKRQEKFHQMGVWYEAPVMEEPQASEAVD